jgi:hypothetical protein
MNGRPSGCLTGAARPSATYFILARHHPLCYEPDVLNLDSEREGNRPRSVATRPPWYVTPMVCKRGLCSFSVSIVAIGAACGGTVDDHRPSSGPADGEADAQIGSGASPPDSGTDGDAASNDLAKASVPESGAPDATLDVGVDGGVCMDECNPGSSGCAANTGAVQKCVGDANCARWVTMATCGSHQACTNTASGSASCTCVPSVCAQQGEGCQDKQTLVTCNVDQNGCLYVASIVTCPSSQSCSGTTPNAACSSTCTGSCAETQTACVPGGLATCSDANGACWAYGTPVGCGPHQGCTGTAGSAACTCNVDPVCASVGAACVTPSTIANCAQDAQGCFYQSWSSSSSCVPGTCSGGRCQPSQR